jgi:hypothetical protein
MAGKVRPASVAEPVGRSPEGGSVAGDIASWWSPAGIRFTE